MSRSYDEVRYELLRPAQVKAIREKAPIAYVPAGSLEWHGLQNPLGTDSLKAHGICCEAALRTGGIVLPPYYQGLLNSPWGPEGWDGYTLSFNEPDTFEAAMLGIVRALVYGQWKVIVGVTGHDVDPQRDAMGRAIEAGTADTDATGFAIKEGELHTADEDLSYTMDHAGAWETSCMMHLHGDTVDLAELTSRGLCTEDHLEMKGAEGIGGHNPVKFASAELGRKIVTRMGEQIAAKAQTLLSTISGG